MADIGTPAGILDSRDLALLVWVTKNGNANVQAEGCDAAYAGHALRFMADRIDPPTDGQAYATLPDQLRASLIGELVRRVNAPEPAAAQVVDIFVETLRGRGYRLVGPASEEADRG